LSQTTCVTVASEQEYNCSLDIMLKLCWRSCFLVGHM